jgi:hypothetical protein
MLGCQGIAHWVTTPSVAFDAAKTPPAPDYGDPGSWAALPGRRSRADALPPGTERAVDPPADAFFVPPTTYFWRRHWNAPADGWLTGLITGATLAGQASAFNGVARIYAPRYRQMTLSGFDDPEVRERGLAVAYEDVRRAFRHYLSEWSEGRPLILAGHSQGSRLVLRLLEEFFAEGPLRDRLVAVYVPGTPVGSGPYERGEATTPICGSREQTSCLVSWRSFAEGADPRLDENPGELFDGRSVCVNPLSWQHGGEPAPSWTNLGSLPLFSLSGTGRPRPNLTGARCGQGALWITPISRLGYRTGHEHGNWHAYDYALFYMNIRENAEQRVRAFLRDRSLR